MLHLSWIDLKSLYITVWTNHLTILSSKSLGCLDSGNVIFGRLCGEICAPFFFGVDFSEDGVLLFSSVVDEIVDAVEEEEVDGDLERNDRSCLSFLSLHKLGKEITKVLKEMDHKIKYER